ncbi:hypothetical protein ACFL6U_14435 [Planctomycetota bacterium]
MKRFGLVSLLPYNAQHNHNRYGFSRILVLWEQCRPTCPKYSTLGKFVREDMDPAWFDYIDFHLTTFGCHICRASYKDLVERTESDQQKTLQERILHSTIGFFTQS